MIYYVKLFKVLVKTLLLRHGTGNFKLIGLHVTITLEFAHSVKENTCEIKNS